MHSRQQKLQINISQKAFLSDMLQIQGVKCIAVQTYL